MNDNNKRRNILDIFDENQNKWIEGEIVDNTYIQFKGWSEKWNVSLQIIPDKYIQKAFTYTKRFRPNIGDIVQIKIENIGKENIYDFVLGKENKFIKNKIFYNNLIFSNKDKWSNGLVIKSSGKFISVLYIYNDYVCIIKVKRDSNIICEKNTHLCSTKQNFFYDIFVRLLSVKNNKIKYLKNIFLNDLEQKENILDYKDLSFILEFVIDNIHYFEDIDKKISFLKLILLYTSSNQKIKKKCYFELAHLYMLTNQNKKIIFRYLCLSGNVNIAMKYVQNKIFIKKNNSNDIIEVLYDFLNIE